MIRKLAVAFLLLAVSVSTGACDDDFSVAGFTADEVFADPDVEGLARAAARGDIETIEAAIADGADVNYSGVQEVTPLFWAYFAESKAGFEKLFQLGADPFHEDHKGRTVAAEAARNEDPAYLDILLRNGLDPNKPEGHRQLPIIFEVISAERWPQLELLMEYCSDLHWKGDGYLESPGLHAAKLHHFDMLERLLNEGYSYAVEHVARFVKTGHEYKGEYADRRAKQDHLLEMLADLGVQLPINLESPSPPIPEHLPPLYAKSCEERRKS